MLQQILYRGPSRDVLHEMYAKNGKIDEGAPVKSTSDIVIDAPVDRVWSVLVNLAAWPTLTPAIRNVRLESEVAVDTFFTFRLYSFPIRAQFAVVSSNRELTWTGRSLWFTAIDRLVVESVAGSTRLSIAEWFTGFLAIPLMSSARLKVQHEQLLSAFKHAAERSAS